MFIDREVNVMTQEQLSSLTNVATYIFLYNLHIDNSEAMSQNTFKQSTRNIFYFCCYLILLIFQILFWLMPLPRGLSPVLDVISQHRSVSRVVWSGCCLHSHSCQSVNALWKTQCRTRKSPVCLRLQHQHNISLEAFLCKAGSVVLLWAVNIKWCLVYKFDSPHVTERYKLCTNHGPLFYWRWFIIYS